MLAPDETFAAEGGDTYGHPVFNPVAEANDPKEFCFLCTYDIGDKKIQSMCDFSDFLDHLMNISSAAVIQYKVKEYYDKYLRQYVDLSLLDLDEDDENNNNNNNGIHEDNEDEQMDTQGPEWTLRSIHRHLMYDSRIYFKYQITYYLSANFSIMDVYCNNMADEDKTRLDPAQVKMYQEVLKTTVMLWQKLAPT